MDKGGEEHLVALQRLENELRLVRERVALALPHLKGHKFFAHDKNSLGGTLSGAASIAEDLQNLKPFWKDLDHAAVDELAEAAGTVAAYVERFLGLRSQGRKVGKQEAKSMSWDIQPHIQSMSKGRSELDVRRVHAVFNRAGSVSDSTDIQHLIGAAIAADSEATTKLVDELEANRVTLMRSERDISVFTSPDTYQHSLVFGLMTVALVGRLSEGTRGTLDRVSSVLAALILTMSFAAILGNLASHIRLRKSLSARARLLEVASNYIRQVGGQVASDAIIDLIAFAWSHRDDWTTKPKEIAKKTEELKALITGTPPSGPTATAAQSPPCRRAGSPHAHPLRYDAPRQLDTGGH